jgi:ribosomal protein S18 acetylase RimI-like enzyme
MLTIRKATSSDAPFIVDFQLKMAWETESLTLEHEIVTKGVNAVFRNPSHGQYYVAENNGSVVASLLVTFEWSDWRNTDVWWIQSVYVLPAFRRKGVFREMYKFVREESVKNGVAGLRLYVESNNKAARKTYESLGMTSEHYTLYEWLR